MTSEYTSSILRDGLQLIRAYGWVQGVSGSYREGFCALGAIYEAAEDVPLSEKYAALGEARDALAHAVDLWYEVPENPGGRLKKHPVAEYNDHFAQSAADIEVIFVEALHRV